MCAHLLTNQQLSKLTMKKILLILFAVALAGCSTSPGPGKPAATGRAGEMLVVMNRAKWDGPAGEVVKNIFGANIPMMLQAESLFDLVHVDESAFVKLFETHRHIFMVDIDEKHARPTVEVNSHVWSYPQMVIRVKAPNDSVFQRVMEANAESFTDYYLEKEMERLINAYKRMSNHQVRNAVREKFNFDLVVPEGFFVAVDADDFMWIRRTGTRQDLEMGVLVSVMPYRDPEVDFNPGTIRQRRDAMTRKFIPGQMPNSYMATYAELDHDYREISFNGRYAVEARGLWRMEGDFMGGPFVNYTLVDEATNRLINLDGFVYAPNLDKRDYLRQLEAIIRSLTFPEDRTEEQQAEPEV
jgi:hypothetical protein